MMCSFFLGRLYEYTVRMNWEEGGQNCLRSVWHSVSISTFCAWLTYIYWSARRHFIMQGAVIIAQWTELVWQGNVRLSWVEKLWYIEPLSCNRLTSDLEWYFFTTMHHNLAKTHSLPAVLYCMPRWPELLAVAWRKNENKEKFWESKEIKFLKKYNDNH